MANNKGKVNTAQMARDARWLLKPAEKGGAGLTHAALGKYLGRSGAWVHHLANGVKASDKARIKPTREQARWLTALCILERNAGKVPTIEARKLDELRSLLGEAIGLADGIARSIARRRGAGRE